MRTVGIIGLGNVGKALAKSFVKHGFRVRTGTRDLAAGTALAGELGDALVPTSIAEVGQGAELVFLTVPASAAVDAVAQAGGLEGGVLVDCTNPLTWQNGPVHAPPPEGSTAAQLQARFPGTRVVKAFNTFGAEIHGDPDFGGSGADLYYAGDDAEAKKSLADAARAIGFNPIDVGPLRNARNLEALAVLWIHLATVGGHGRQLAFRLVRRER